MRKKQKKRREKSEFLFFSFTFLYFSKISIYNYVLSVFTFILLYYHGFYKQSNGSFIDVIIKLLCISSYVSFFPSTPPFYIAEYVILIFTSLQDYILTSYLMMRKLGAFPLRSGTR